MKLKPIPSVTALASRFASRQSAFLFAAAIAGLLSGPQAQGATLTWAGNTSAALGTAANWTTNLTPTSGDNFIFGAAGSQGASLTNGLTAGFSVAGFTFNSGASAFAITGNAITLTGNITNNSTAAQTIGLNISATAVRTVTTSTGDVTLGGIISGTAGGITKAGTGTLTLSNANTYTGVTTVSAGTLIISGASAHTGANTVNGGTLNITGALTSAAVGVTTVNGGTLLINGANGRTGNATAAGIVVNPNGTLTIDNSSNNNNARISDLAQTTLNGGNFEFRGNTLADTQEVMGTINLAGPSSITLTRGSASFRTQIASASFNYTAGTGATLVNGINLGRTSTPTTGNTLFTFTTAPTLVGTTAALTTGINSAVKNTQIVPFLLGEATSTTGGTGTATGSANTFVTYVAGSGLRPLNLTDEFDTSTTLVSGNNVRVTGATAVSSNVAINSMILDSAGVTIADGTTLTNSSGALMFSSTNSIAPSGTTGVLAFGSAAAQVTVLPTFTGTISAGISGTGGLVKNGSGNLILSGSGSYTGPTSVNGGNVSFTGSLTPSDSSSALIVNNPNKGAGTAIALNLSSSAPTSVGSLSGTNSTPSSGTNTSKIDNGGQLLTINQTTGGTFDGGISGAGGLTKTGSGTLIIASNSTYTGATTISAGTLRLTSTAAGSAASTSSISVASGATFELVLPGSATNTLAAALTLAGNGSALTVNIPSNNTQTNNFTGGVTLVGGAIFRTFGLINSYNFNDNKITGDATATGLVFRSEGGNSANQAHTYNINVAADYTGNTTLSSVSQQGVIRLGVANALPTTTILTLIGSSNANSAPSLNLNGFNQTLAGLTAASATGVPRVVNSVVAAATLTINSTANQTMAGVLGGTGTNNNNFALTKTGTGIFSLSGANTYAGATAVNGGTLSLLNTTAKSANSAFTVASGATLGLGVSAASNPFTSANVDSLFAGTLTGYTNHANSNVGIDTTGGNFSYTSAVPSTTRGLNKLGANTLNLTAASLYSGPTIISAGTLALGAAGSISSSPSITVATGAMYNVSAVTGYTVGATQTLAGGGNVTGAVIVSGTHAPGITGTASGVGTQAFSSTLKYNTGSIFEWSLSSPTTGAAALANGGTYDQVTASGALTGADGGAAAIFKVVLTGTAAFTDAFWSTSKSWNNIFTGGSGSATNLASIFTSFDPTGGLNSAGLVAGVGSFSLNSSSNTLNWTPVPEPTSALAGLLLGAGLLRRRRA